MDIKDIKVGMKVRLLGKHALFDEYDNIDDWYEDCIKWEEVQRIKEQGFGVVTNIDEDGEVWVADDINNCVWCFLSSDLEPYEEELTGESTSIKTPKKWLLTPLAIFITRDKTECITLRNNTACFIDDGTKWSEDLNEEYNEDLIYIDDYDGNDIMQITYNGEVVWERKEYMTLTDAIKTGKNIKHKDWTYFCCPTQALITISNDVCLISLFTDKVWEVE